MIITVLSLLGWMLMVSASAWWALGVILSRRRRVRPWR